MVESMDNFELSLPLDLTHHYSETSKQRIPSSIKAFYKYFQIPGIANLAGGTARSCDASTCGLTNTRTT